MMAATVEAAVVLNDFCYVQGGASKVAIDEAMAFQRRRPGRDVPGRGRCAVRGAARCRRARDLARSAGIAAGLAPSGRRVALAPGTARLSPPRESLLARQDPSRTVVHLHGYTKALSTSPALAARLAGFATVCTLHDFFAACPNGAFYDYRREEPCQRRALSLSCMLTNCDKRHPLHKSYRVARGVAQRHFARFPDSVRDFIALSRRSVDVVAALSCSRTRRLYPLPNIIDMPRAPPVDVANNRPLLVLGRLDAEKGVMLAATAAQQAGHADRVCRRRTAARRDGGGRRHRHRLAGYGRCMRRHWSRRAAWCFPAAGMKPSALLSRKPRRAACRRSSATSRAASERVIDGVTGWVFRSGDAGGSGRCMHVTRAGRCGGRCRGCGGLCPVLGRSAGRAAPRARPAGNLRSGSGARAGRQETPRACLAS